MPQPNLKEHVGLQTRRNNTTISNAVEAKEDEHVIIDNNMTNNVNIDTGRGTLTPAWCTVLQTYATAVLSLIRPKSCTCAIPHAALTSRRCRSSYQLGTVNTTSPLISADASG